MLLFFNEENLQFPEMVLTDKINKIFFKYMNFLMFEVYKVFSQHKLPRVFPVMKEFLQFSPEKRNGDWFLLEEGIVIRVYVFTHEPYILHAFLTPMIFALELIKQNLIVENDHFINFRKASKIKFPWVLGPFIVKIKYALPVVESLLKYMGFQTSTAINYDPHHVISIRRQVNKNNPFEHQEVEGLIESAN